MKPFFALLLSAVLLATAPAHGQGMLSIGQSSDYHQPVPLTFSVTAGGGYDHIDYGDPDMEDVDSFFLYGGVGLLYGNDNRVTKWNVGLDLGTVYYLDDMGGDDNFDYNARLSFNIAHQFNRRLSVNDNLYFSYESEPDYGIGASAGRRAGQYVYGYNDLSVSYAWSERISTTTGYTVEGIRYTEDDAVAGLEDRITHTFRQDISYALSRRTKLVGEYRFRINDYRHSQNNQNDDGTDDGNDDDTDDETDDGTNDGTNPDYTSHYILAGVDMAWSERTSVSFRAGAEIYESDRSDETAPYAEASITYAVSRLTTARLYAQAGFDPSGLGTFDSRYSIRTGIVADHQFTSRLSGSVGVHYIHSDYGGNDEVDSTKEDEVNAGVGLTYNFWNNLSLDANYSYTTISSDTEFADYDRHRISLGLNATF